MSLPSCSLLACLSHFFWKHRLIPTRTVTRIHRVMLSIHMNADVRTGLVSTLTDHKQLQLQLVTVLHMFLCIICQPSFVPSSLVRTPTGPPVRYYLGGGLTQH